MRILGSSRKNQGFGKKAAFNKKQASEEMPLLLLCLFFNREKPPQCFFCDNRREKGANRS
jgi:hypothetical protein